MYISAFCVSAAAPLACSHIHYTYNLLSYPASHAYENQTNECVSQVVFLPQAKRGPSGDTIEASGSTGGSHGSTCALVHRPELR